MRWTRFGALAGATALLFSGSCSSGSSDTGSTTTTTTGEAKPSTEFTTYDVANLEISDMTKVGETLWLSGSCAFVSVSTSTGEELERVKPESQWGFSCPTGSIGANSQDVAGVNSGDNSIEGFDTGTLTAVPSIFLSTDDTDFSEPDGIAGSRDGFWVTDRARFVVALIDLGSGQVLQEYDAGPLPAAVVETTGALWVANEDDEGSVSRLDLSSGEVTDTISVGSNPSSLAIGPDPFGTESIWVTNSSDDTVSVISTDERMVTATYDVGAEPGDIAVGEDSAWVVNGGDGTVSRIDVESGAVADTIDVCDDPVAVVMVGGDTWIACRGGSLNKSAGE